MLVSTSMPMRTRPALIDWYVRNRARSKGLFDLVSEEAYYSRPIALRHPIVFYEGHLPAFSFNTLVKRGLGSWLPSCGCAWAVPAHKAANNANSVQRSRKRYRKPNMR